MTSKTSDNTRVPLELVCSDQMGQYVFSQLPDILRQVGTRVARPGFFVVEFPTTPISERQQHVDQMWVDQDETGDAVPLSIRNAHLKQFTKAVKHFGGDQVEWCALLFYWAKEHLQQSVLLHLPTILESKEVDRRRYQQVDKEMAKYKNASTFVRTRFQHQVASQPLFFNDDQRSDRYIWKVCRPTVGTLMHMVAMHQRNALLEEWQDVQDISRALQSRMRGEQDCRCYMAFDRKSIVEAKEGDAKGKNKFQILEAAQGTAVGCIVTAHVVSSKDTAQTELSVLYAHVDPDHDEHVRERMLGQVAEFAENFNVTKAQMADLGTEASDRYKKWILKHGSSVVEAATSASKNASQKGSPAPLASSLSLS